jgi:hypothetical protein
MHAEMDVDLEGKLVQIIRSHAWFMRVLEAVAECNLPDWCVGAGALRNIVWDHLHGHIQPSHLADVDVAFFDSADLSPERERAIQRQLTERVPDVPWEVTNQAGVHLWFEQYFGSPVEPLQSIQDAVATWPETATSVAVRLTSTGAIDVIAPVGLEDLFAMVVRRNPRRVSVEIYRQRIAEKQYLNRWPKVRIIES